MCFSSQPDHEIECIILSDDDEMCDNKDSSENITPLKKAKQSEIAGIMNII